MTIEQGLLALAIGLVAGVVGGLAGIGGSIIMLPALSLLFVDDSPDQVRHHEYMAAAMAVNVVVALSARREHAKAGAVRRDLVWVLLPTAALAIVLGVLVSNSRPGTTLRLALVAFLFLYCAYNIFTAIRGTPEDAPDRPVRRPIVAAIGALTGFMGGFLGIGGGVVMVPGLQMLASIPLRQAIGASAAVMWMTALIGSALKIGTLHQHGLAWQDALLLAAPMGLGAVVGAKIGAMMTHRLRLPHLKLAISAILAATAARMAGLF